MTDREQIIELAKKCGMDGLSLIDVGYLEAFYNAATKPLIKQLENERANGIHTCGPDCSKSGCVNRRLREQRDVLLAALKRIASGEAENGSILSGGECQSIAYEVIIGVKGNAA